MIDDSPFTKEDMKHCLNVLSLAVRAKEPTSVSCLVTAKALVLRRMTMGHSAGTGKSLEEATLEAVSHLEQF